jgi:hypothetical protein
MKHDDIVEDVRKIREEIARENNYDLRSILSAIQKVPLPSGSRTVQLPPKRLGAPKKASR